MYDFLTTGPSLNSKMTHLKSISFILPILTFNILSIHAAIAQTSKATPSKNTPSKPTATPVKTTAKKGALVSFEHTKFDFGPINENVKFATHRFNYTNVGDAPLIINNVQTSCGCTTPEWTHDTLMPGESGFVNARYETTNRIGKFQKSVTVYTNSTENAIIFLDISGDVYREGVDLESNTQFQYNYGKITFSKPSISFSPLLDNAVDTQTIVITNETPQTVDFYALDPKILPSYLQVLSWPTTLEPDEHFKIKVQIDSRKINYYGFGTYEIPINSGSPAMPFGSILVTFTRKQYFPKLSASQLAKTPRLTLDKKEHNFGAIEATGDLITTEFKFTNSGKQVLKIFNLDPSCGCITVKAPKMQLQPGESMQVRVIFDTVTKKGYANYSIGIVCNDPTNPEFSIPIKAQFPTKAKICPTCPQGQ